MNQKRAAGPTKIENRRPGLCPCYINEVQAIAEQWLSDKRRQDERNSHTYKVLSLTQTSRPHGMSNAELRRASEAAHIMAKTRGTLNYTVVSQHGMSEAVIRNLASEFKREVVKAQEGAGNSKYWLEMLEGEPTVHANLLFTLNPTAAARLIARLSGSQYFPGDTLHWQSGYDANGFVSYCSKERTPQAKYIGGITMTPRRPGSHPLGAGGGDRVRLSKALQDRGEAMNVIQPYQRTYAKRGLENAVLVRQVINDAAFAAVCASEKLIVVREPLVVSPQQLWLPLGPPVRDLYQQGEAKRLALGLSQRAVALRLGVNQPQYSNCAIRRHGRFSPWVSNRAREFVADGLAAGRETLNRFLN